VENGDLAGMSRLLTRWLAIDGAARTAMEENAQKCFTNRFEIERATDSLLAVLAAHTKNP
jgi:hypothetical protein